MELTRPKLQEIISRKWDDLREQWFIHIPTFGAPGRPPEFEISQTDSLNDIVKEVPEDGHLLCEVAGIRSSILHEGIFLLHKAFNVARSAESNIKNGLLTWSLSSGYHSAFFASKSIMCFLGVSYFEINNSSYLIDTWISQNTSKKVKSIKGLEVDNTVKIITIPRLLHYQVWQIFQRILRISSVNIWSPFMISFLKNLNSKDLLANEMLYIIQIILGYWKIYTKNTLIWSSVILKVYQNN